MFQESVSNMKTTAFSKLSQTNYWIPLVTFLEIKQKFLPQYAKLDLALNSMPTSINRSQSLLASEKCAKPTTVKRQKTKMCFKKGRPWNRNN